MNTDIIPTMENVESEIQPIASTKEVEIRNELTFPANVILSTPELALIALLDNKEIPLTDIEAFFLSTNSLPVLSDTSWRNHIALLTPNVISTVIYPNKITHFYLSNEISLSYKSLAGHFLNWMKEYDMNLSDIFDVRKWGKSNIRSSTEKTRINTEVRNLRLNILVTLSNSVTPMYYDDFLKLFPNKNTEIEINKLRSKDLINFLDKPSSKKPTYKFSPDIFLYPEDLENLKGSKVLAVQMLEKFEDLRANGVGVLKDRTIDLDSIFEYIQTFPEIRFKSHSRLRISLSEILKIFEEKDYLININKQKGLEISLMEDKKIAVREFIEILKKYNSNDMDFIADGLRFCYEIVRDKYTISRLFSYARP